MNSKLKKLLRIIIPVVLLFLISLRLTVYYFRTDGFSGLSTILPLLIIGFVVFGLAASVCFSAWVYEDCKKRSDDGILWAVIVFAVTPFIGMLIYFLRRSEIKQTCLACEHKISLEANYCENCGSAVKSMEVVVMEKRTHNMKLIVTGTIFMLLTLACLTGFIASAAIGDQINTNIASNEKVWNTGTISMNGETHLNDIWKLDFKSASDGFVKESKFKITDASTQKLFANIQCGNVPEGAALTLWIVQGNQTKSVDVTNLEKPLEYALNEFASGDIRVRLQIHGVENVTSEIYIN